MDLQNNVIIMEICTKMKTINIVQNMIKIMFN